MFSELICCDHITFGPVHRPQCLSGPAAFTFPQFIEPHLELDLYFAHVGYIEIVAEDDMITSKLPGIEVVETSADTNLHMERNNITETTRPDVINNHESSAPLRYGVIRERQNFGPKMFSSGSCLLLYRSYVLLCKRGIAPARYYLVKVRIHFVEIVFQELSLKGL